MALPWSYLPNPQPLSRFHLKRPRILPHQLGFLNWSKGCPVVKKTLFISPHGERPANNSILSVTVSIQKDLGTEPTPHTFQIHWLPPQETHSGTPTIKMDSWERRCACELDGTSITWPSCFSLPLEWPACAAALGQRRQLPPEHFTDTVKLLYAVSDH